MFPQKARSKMKLSCICTKPQIIKYFNSIFETLILHSSGVSSQHNDATATLASSTPVRGFSNQPKCRLQCSHLRWNTPRTCRKQFHFCQHLDLPKNLFSQIGDIKIRMMYYTIKTTCCKTYYVSHTIGTLPFCN